MTLGRQVLKTREIFFPAQFNLAYRAIALFGGLVHGYPTPDMLIAAVSIAGNPTVSYGSLMTIDGIS